MKGPRVTMMVVFLLGISVTQSAWAHWRGGHGRHGVGVGIVIGPALGWGYYPPPYYDYPPPYYYYGYPQPVFVPPPSPPVYIEQPPAERVAPPPQTYWYYCSEPQGYYPTVKECPAGWLKVLPREQPTP